MGRATKPAEDSVREMIHPSDQLARLKGAPSLVLWLVQDAGCWIVGSRADFSLDRVTETSDWDIVVPLKLWQNVVGALPFDLSVPSRRGGWRIKRDGEPDIDIIACDIGDWLTNTLTRVAWHPKSGTVVEKR